MAAALVAVGVILLLSISYSSARALVRRREGAAPATAGAQDLRFVIVVPLRLGADVDATVAQLRALPGDPEIRAGAQSLLELRQWARDQEVSESEVLVGVVEPGHELSHGALVEITGYFAEASTGAVQLAPRVARVDGLRDRVEDLDLVLLAGVNEGRQQLGALGLGGGGQFLRLRDLVEEGVVAWPPTGEPAADLEVGAGLAAEGRTNHVCTAATVSRPAARTFGELLARQHAWAYAHASTWRSLRYLTAPADEHTSRSVTAAIARALLTPVSNVVTALLVPVLLVALVVVAFRAEGGPLEAAVANGGLLLLLAYVVLFGLAPLHGFVYWLRSDRSSLLKAMLVAHAHALYALAAAPGTALSVARGLRGR